MRTKQYTIPNVPGYFANISSIAELAVLHDAPIDEKQRELYLYFNDLYQVFMHRFSEFALSDTTDKADEDKLASMFVELVKTKRMLRGEEEPF